MKLAAVALFVAVAAAAQDAPPLDPGLYATLTTSMGKIVFQIFEDAAPGAARNFVALARGEKLWRDSTTGELVRRPLYADITFHRVIPNFLIQTGDPTGTGAHDCGFTIRDEIVPDLEFDRAGRVGLARGADANTGGCQFFITDAPYPSITGQYTIFGQVVEGLDVVAKIARAPRGRNNQPTKAVFLIDTVVDRVDAAPNSGRIRVGMTPSEVASILGPPEKTAEVGPKLIFIYRDLKITFIDGKLTDAQ